MNDIAQNKLKQFIKPALVIALASAIAGCDSMPNMDDTFSGRKVDYKKQSRDVEPLEIPPDLTMSVDNEIMSVPDINTFGGESSSASDSSYTESSKERQSGTMASSRVLPKQDDIQLVKEGNVRHLVIHGSEEQVWDKMREFWLNSGFLIKREEPRAGILETEWAENRADIPQDFIRSTLSKVMESFYSAATRDKYRVRLERDEQPGVIDLYLTHYGMEEVIDGNDSVGESTIWKARPRDPELEAEMLGRMMVYFGVEEQKARTMLARETQEKAERAIISRNAEGNSRLIVKETFPRAWRRTGVALDRVNFVVEDRNREEGIYYVQYADPMAEEKKKGFFSGMKFWKDDVAVDKTKYQIKMLPRGDDTVVIVLDANGQPDTSTTSYRILNLLHEQLR
jgi:outer membrane protein assembly factor BamC